jgi:hypothetical protein
MKPTDSFSVLPLVVAREVGEQNVLLDLMTDTSFSLDPIGARIWQLIEEGKPFAEVCDALIEEYDVTRDELERDVKDYIEDLLEKRLITVG